MYNYKAKLVRVVDGDTADVMIDLGFNVWTKQRLRFKTTPCAYYLFSLDKTLQKYIK